MVTVDGEKPELLYVTVTAEACGAFVVFVAGVFVGALFVGM